MILTVADSCPHHAFGNEESSSTTRAFESAEHFLVRIAQDLDTGVLDLRALVNAAEAAAARESVD